MARRRRWRVRWRKDRFIVEVLHEGLQQDTGGALEDNIASRSAAPPFRMHFPTTTEAGPRRAGPAHRRPELSTAAAKKEARAFIAHYYEQVDVEDLQIRSVEDLYGAAMAHMGFARRSPAARPRSGCTTLTRRRAWVVEPAHGDRDRQRRHAVPGRFGDDGGEQAGLHVAHHQPPIFGTQRDKGGSSPRSARRPRKGRPNR